MKISWIRIKENEDYLTGNLEPAQHLLFGAELLVDTGRLMEVHFQSETYDLVRLYARKKLKEEIEAVHEKLFTEESSFKERVLGFFR